MKTVSTVIFAGVILCGSSLAQDATQPRTTSTAPPSQQGPATAQPAQSSAGQVNTSPRIAPGSVIPVQLLKSIDAKKVKTGDEVTAKVTQDMKTGSGEIVVPKDTQVIGHISE